jgi:hypothetical protein
MQVHHPGEFFDAGSTCRLCYQDLEAVSTNFVTSFVVPIWPSSMLVFVNHHIFTLLYYIGFEHGCSRSDYYRLSCQSGQAC